MNFMYYNCSLKQICMILAFSRVKNFEDHTHSPLINKKRFAFQVHIQSKVHSKETRHLPLADNRTHTNEKPKLDYSEV